MWNIFWFRWQRYNSWKRPLPKKVTHWRGPPWESIPLPVQFGRKGICHKGSESAARPVWQSPISIGVHCDDVNAQRNQKLLSCRTDIRLIGWKWAVRRHGTVSRRHSQEIYRQKRQTYITVSLEDHFSNTLGPPFPLKIKLFPQRPQTPKHFDILKLSHKVNGFHDCSDLWRSVESKIKDQQKN